MANPTFYNYAEVIQDKHLDGQLSILQTRFNTEHITIEETIINLKNRGVNLDNIDEETTRLILQNYVDDRLEIALRWRARLLAILLLHERSSNYALYERLWEDNEIMAEYVEAKKEEWNSDRKCSQFYVIEHIIEDLTKANPKDPEEAAKLLEHMTQEFFLYIIKYIDTFFNGDYVVDGALLNIAYGVDQLTPAMRQVFRNLLANPILLDAEMDGITVKTSMDLKKAFLKEFEAAKLSLGKIIVIEQDSLTTKEVAYLLNISTTMVRKLIKNGTLKATKEDDSDYEIWPGSVWVEWRKRWVKWDMEELYPPYDYEKKGHPHDFWKKTMFTLIDWLPANSFLLDFEKMTGDAFLPNVLALPYPEEIQTKD